MSNYILAYHGGVKPKSPEEGTEQMDRWKAWASDLGEVLINPGTPLGMSKTISSSGIANNGGSNPLTGYSVLKADSLDEAIDMIKDCPHLEHGTMEVAEMLEMQH